MRSFLRAFVVMAACGWSLPAIAADHGEAPLTRSDAAADIADVYAWHEGGRLITVVTFDGIKSPAPGQRGTFDPGVLYTLNIDNTGDFVPDLQVHTRFVKSRRGRWGVLIENLPGAGGTVIGPVERRLRCGAAWAFAGLRDDPFFFDLEGFRETLATGTLSFNGKRDTFAGTNATAIVLEMNLADALGAGKELHVWATTARGED